MGYWNDKVAVITGGSRGLGLSIARAAAQAGAKVVLVARNPLQLANATSELATVSQAVSWLEADLTKDDQVAPVMNEVARLHGRIDLLVNCAGRSDRGAVADQTAEHFRELLDLNFLAAVRTTQAALPYLLQSHGHVVQVGSLASKVASRYLGAYAASKFPLAAYAQQLRLELGPQGLHTLLVCPGPIRRNDAGSRYDASTGGLPETARQPGAGVKLRGIDPDSLAQKILQACERRQAELIVPARAKWLFAIAQLWPALGDWIVLRMTK